MPKLQNWSARCVKCGRPGTAYQTWTGQKRKHQQVKYAHHVKVDGKWKVEWCYVPRSFIGNAKNRIEGRNERKRRNIEGIVGSLLPEGTRGARIWHVQPDDVSRRTAIRYMSELRKAQVVDRFEEMRLGAPVYTYRLADWATSYVTLRGPKGIMGSEGRQYKRLYYETLILKLIYENPKHVMFSNSIESALYRNPRIINPGQVRILTEGQVYEYLLELVKNGLIISPILRRMGIGVLSSWTTLRFALTLHEGEGDVWFTLWGKALSLLEPSAQQSGRFPMYYKDSTGKLHLWVECCLPN
jgi:hypothetical protein